MTSNSKAIALIIPLIVKNNAGKVAIALKEICVEKDFLPAGKMESNLFQLYIYNPDAFFDVMKSIPWNPGESETNKPEIKDKLIRLVTENTNNEISKTNWWPELIELLSKEPHPEKEEVKMEICFSLGFLLVLTGLGLVIALCLIFRSN